MRIFVTVGTTKFNELIKKVDSLEFLEVAHELKCNHVVVQIGTGEYEPSEILLKNDKGIDVTVYRFKVEYKNDVKEADLIISHAGAGSIMDALGSSKKLVTVVNSSLMGNHQTELATAMHEKMYCIASTLETFLATLRTADFESLVPYPSIDYNAFPKLLDQEMGYS